MHRRGAGKVKGSLSLGGAANGPGNDITLLGGMTETLGRWRFGHLLFRCGAIVSSQRT